AHAQPDAHLRTRAREPVAHAVRGHPLTGADHRLAGGVVLVVAGELLDVAGILIELLIELELTRLRIGGGARDADLLDARLPLRFGDLGVRLDEPLAIFVA